MPVPYSEDLRRKAIEKVDSGLSPSEVAKLFNIDRSTIYDWLNVRNWSYAHGLQNHPQVLQLKSNN